MTTKQAISLTWPNTKGNIRKSSLVSTGEEVTAGKVMIVNSNMRQSNASLVSAVGGVRHAGLSTQTMETQQLQSGKTGRMKTSGIILPLEANLNTILAFLF